MDNPTPKPLVYVVDDDADLAAALARLLSRHGYAAEPFMDPAQLLAAYDEAPAACVISDIMMAEVDGFTFADRLRERDGAAAIIFITGWPTTTGAVDSIRRHGGLDYLEKPIDETRLMTAVEEGVAWSVRRRAQLERTARLTPRERDVFALLVRGYSNKAIAAELNLSPKTVDDHRAHIVSKTGASGLAQLIAIADEQN